MFTHTRPDPSALTAAVAAGAPTDQLTEQLVAYYENAARVSLERALLDPTNAQYVADLMHFFAGIHRVVAGMSYERQRARRGKLASYEATIAAYSDEIPL